ADSLSRMFVNVLEEPGHGHEWTVSEDWEAKTGLTHDLFVLQPSADGPSPTNSTPQIPEAEQQHLLARFAKEPLHTSVLKALFELDHGTDERERKKAVHRAREYMVEAGKLWRIADGRRPRAKARMEVVTQGEMTELAREEHEHRGHYKRD
ncbi:hypothetical protein FIBSPDRAFT_679662, partial [Athelia psychrophila]